MATLRHIIQDCRMSNIVVFVRFSSVYVLNHCAHIDVLFDLSSFVDLHCVYSLVSSWAPPCSSDQDEWSCPAHEISRN